MFETDKITGHAANCLNECFDIVPVPDPYQQAGVTKPIFYLPLLVNLDEFLRAPIKVKAK
ncbi:hypothetical protein midi_00698 [Candidatus Midichloria mitochondrii IricVA]|uniref:Uncharacterized protein n=2 Tax=Candidatus Midichloria mitochondrii TaxID=234827 RepID=F7XWE5_MIDMI|nr:hypothetical protein midi_00698 [Candidatus Midichloria mitochondrii IricVA]